MNKRFLLGLLALLMSMLACEPVIAIGWRELFFIFILMSFLFGPPLYRFIRRVENFRRNDRKKKE
ncbi:MAG TPA: hypothetical protein VF918_10435 [Anaerolineales bacterium]